MANMNATANPLGRWWHPLPLMSGIGCTIGMIISKLTGMITMPWWAVIAVPIGADVAVNLVILAAWAIGAKISDIADKRKEQRHGTS